MITCACGETHEPTDNQRVANYVKCGCGRAVIIAKSFAPPAKTLDGALVVIATQCTNYCNSRAGVVKLVALGMAEISCCKCGKLREEVSQGNLWGRLQKRRRIILPRRNGRT